MDFQSGQIVCLEHQQDQLYGEVVQMVPERQICWVRPLLLAVASSAASLASPYADPLEGRTLHDLRQSADLLWPAQLFRPALDTELLPLLGALVDPAPSNPAARQQLQGFVQRIWHAHSGLFAAS
ncbi:hypothetical protein [Geitlerinema sp. PCC 7407]|uniref:hypothetical protein n=1 Tax=Geitlerinema sp. PCC 7407 TaxID=1173025 RepID=UPI00029FBCE8|nr:hypothetical protein [Geitlerinema sp. PCC 7407]AFY67315.1 hypothetical protein GEI7407_2844 [Geitlerinema sp. PCC 7407]